MYYLYAFKVIIILLLDSGACVHGEGILEAPPPEENKIRYSVKMAKSECYPYRARAQRARGHHRVYFQGHSMDTFLVREGGGVWIYCKSYR